MFKKAPRETKAERDFRTILDIVKDYDKAGFNKLMDAVEQCWKGYDIIYRTKTRDEKEDEDIAKTERELKYLEKDNEPSN
jgi:predicted metal-dependent HD superfamily phosphohydrolase